MRTRKFLSPMTPVHRLNHPVLAWHLIVLRWHRLTLTDNTAKVLVQIHLTNIYFAR